MRPYSLFSILWTIACGFALSFAPSFLRPSSCFGDPGPDSSGAAYMGVGSCSSSNCHGNAAPRKGSNILHNEYVTWTKHDAHAKAWTALTSADGKKIAKNLKMRAPETEPQCLTCHAVLVPTGVRTDERFTIQDGVSCEACHGAAEKYLKPHAESGASHKNNLEYGLRDLAAPEKRVQLCLGCHYGTKDRFVDHELIGAGHPRLTFELDTFTQIMPTHWVIDDDYRERKGAYSSAQFWIVGQLVRAREMMFNLSSARSKSGALPELTNFYCYSCHHSLSEEQWKKREYGGTPGRLLLNISSAQIAQLALSVLDPRAGESLEAGLQDVHKAYRMGDLAPAQEIMSQLDAAVKKISEKPIEVATLRELRGRLVKFGSETPYLQYEVAEQIAMGLSSLMASLGAEGKSQKAQIDRLYIALKNPREFKSEDFTAACKKIRIS